MGKWYTAVSDFRKGNQMAKNPPLFKKLFNAGSVEEEALALLMHEKKISLVDFNKAVLVVNKASILSGYVRGNRPSFF